MFNNKKEKLKLYDYHLNKTFDKKKNNLIININSYPSSAEKDKYHEMKNNKIINSKKLTFSIKNEQKKFRPQSLNKRDFKMTNNQLHQMNSKAISKTSGNFDIHIADLNLFEKKKKTNHMKLINESRETYNKTNSKDRTNYFSVNNTYNANTNTNTNTNSNTYINNIINNNNDFDNIIEKDSEIIKTNERELNITKNNSEKGKNQNSKDNEKNSENEKNQNNEENENISENDKNPNINAMSSDNIKNLKSFNKTNSDNFNYNISNESLCEYYSFKDKLIKIQKRREKLLIDSHNFHLYNNERWILNKLRQFKNKNIEKELKENGLDFYGKKFKLYTDIRNVPTKVCFRKGNSASKIKNEDLDSKYNNKFVNHLINKKNKGITEKNNYNYHKMITQGFPKTKTSNNDAPFEHKLIVNSNSNYKMKKNNFIMNQEIYPLINQKKILKNILPKEVDYNTQYTIMDVINEELHPLNRFQKKNLTQHSNLISQEIELLFGKNITLSKIPFHSNIYQNSENRIEYNTGEKFNKLISSLIEREKGESIMSPDVIEERKRKIIRRKYLLDKFKETIKLCMVKFKRLKISRDFFWAAIYCEDEITYQDGLYVFKAIKDGDVNSVKKSIKSNFKLASFQDEFQQTPLHICAKRNMYQVVQLLVSRLCSVNAQDVYGRTPLMCAAQGNHMESICVLLFSFADPNYEDKSGKKAVDYAKDGRIKYALTFARIVYLFNKMMNNSKNFDEFVLRGMSHLFSKDIGINYEPWLKINEEIQNKDDEL
jgi:hypothetical protein